MTQGDELRGILKDVVEVMQLEVKELEKLVKHVEQVTVRLPEPHQFSVVASELSALHVRLKQLEEAGSSAK